jgi:dienelactone hydrolase
LVRRPPTAPEQGENLEALRIHLKVVDAAGRRATAHFWQTFLAAGVTRTEVREPAFSGTVFTPSGSGPYPVMVVLNGSGGGTPERAAALYAAHGYIGFALPYFKAPGRPDYISDTPLEYFGTAFEWIATTLQPKSDFIAVSGTSRGGELSLLLGAYFPERVSAVVAYVPSAVVHGTLRAGRPEQRRDAAVWTWRGEALPNVWRGNPHADWSAFDNPPVPGAPIRQAPAFDSVERDPACVASARIPVERIRGPVLLLSGDDDGFWPSTKYSRTIVADLEARGHRWPVEHVHNEGAGHAIGFPYVPTTQIAKIHPVAGVLIGGGGTAPANAKANRQSWSRVLAFLHAAAASRGASA